MYGISTERIKLFMKLNEYIEMITSRQSNKFRLKIKFCNRINFDYPDTLSREF